MQNTYTFPLLLINMFFNISVHRATGQEKRPQAVQGGQVEQRPQQLPAVGLRGRAKKGLYTHPGEVALEYVLQLWLGGKTAVSTAVVEDSAVDDRYGNFGSFQVRKRYVISAVLESSLRPIFDAYLLVFILKGSKHKNADGKIFEKTVNLYV